MRLNRIQILRLVGAVVILLSGFLAGCGEKALPPAPQPNKADITITGDAV